MRRNTSLPSISSALLTSTVSWGACGALRTLNATRSVGLQAADSSQIVRVLSNSCASSFSLGVPVSSSSP
uniref:Putative secreted protein n=1 Tax=Anopheles marajoara TaxID=58244 RepID=A0A2M4CEM2_9DIPT